MSRGLEAASGTQRADDAAARIGAAQGAFDAIRVDYAYQDDAVTSLLAFMHSHAKRPVGAPCAGASLVAAYGTGKTETLKKLRARVGSDGPGSMPVLRAEIPTSGHIDHVPDAILTALKVPRPEVGRPAFRWSKALSKMAEAGVQLLCVDEFDRAARRPTMSQPIANVLRERIMDAGVAPIVFAGSESAGDLLGSCGALFDRLVAQIPLDPLDLISTDDETVAADFLSAVDARLEEDGILADPSQLADRTRVLVEASGGRLRQIMKILRAGLGVTAERGGRSISENDLALGWMEIPHPIGAPANPFRAARA